MQKSAGLVVVGVLMGTCLILMLVGVSAINREQRLRNAITAQQEALKTSFDRSWKTIAKQAEVTMTERESFRKTYTEIMQSTKGVAGDGKLASFFTQAQINVSPELFAKLMTTIEAQRASFNRDQEHLLKLKEEHDNIRTTLPSSLFVGNAAAIQLQLVTSEQTDAAFDTGHEDNIHVFGAAPPPAGQPTPVAAPK